MRRGPDLWCRRLPVRLRQLVSSCRDGSGKLPCEVGRQGASSKTYNRKGSGGAEQLSHATQRRLLVHVVKGSDAGDEVERRPLEGVGEEVSHDVLDTVSRAIAPGLCDALFVRVDADDVVDHAAELTHQPAFATADVEREAG